MLAKRLIKSNDAGGGACTNTVDLYNPFPDGGGVALYQLNGDATDVSGNYDGTWSGTEAYSTGVFGQAATISGGAYIDTSLTYNSDELTVSVWVYSTGTADQLRPLNTGNTSSNLGYQVRIDPNGDILWWLFGNNSSGGLVTATSAFTLNQWNHIVGTYNQTTGDIRLYVNGEFKAGKTNIQTSTPSTYPLRIGNQVGTSDTQPYSIDQVRIFDTALDPLEVEALYTEELCICDGTVDTLQVLGDTSCIATYQLDGNANDLSGNYSGQATNVSYGVGEFDLAGVFNGSTSNIQIDTFSGFTNYNFTLSVWIKTTDSVGYAIGFRDPIYMALGPGLFSGSTNGMGIYDGTNQYFINNTAMQSINDGSWKHIVMTHDGTNLKGYINGSIIDTVPTGTTTQFSGGTNFNRIGVRADGNTSAAFNGELDQVRIFNKALDQNEVETLWLESACTKGACSGTTHTLNILGGGDTSCIAAYPLDGSPADLSGNYNGVQTDVTYPQGYFDLAAAFDTSSIQTELTTAFNLQEFSFSFWAKPSLVNSTNQELLGNYSSANQGWILRLTDSNKFSFLTSLPAVYATSTTTPVVDTWYNIVVTNSSSNGVSKIYINNSLEDTVTYTAGTQIPYTTGGMNLAMGAGLSDTLNARFFKGQIDQVRIFNKALNSTEVGILFNDETPCN